MALTFPNSLQTEADYDKIVRLPTFKLITRRLVSKIISLQDTLDREPYSISVAEELDSSLELFYHLIRTAKKNGLSIAKITTLGCYLGRTKRKKDSTNILREFIVSTDGQYRIERINRNGNPSYQFAYVYQPYNNSYMESVWFCSLNA